MHVSVSENLIPALFPNATVVGELFDVEFDGAGDLPEFSDASRTAAFEETASPEAVGH